MSHTIRGEDPVSIKYYTLMYTYEAAGELATSTLKGFPIVDFSKFQKETAEQIASNGIVWIMGGGTLIGIPASRITNVTLEVEN
jgi:hypothetical protein